jgi:predicted nucleic acid-binding protein
MRNLRQMPKSDLVIDASLLAASLLPDETGPDLLRLEQEYRRILAPFLIWAEFRNIFIIQERRGRINLENSDEAIRIFDSLRVQFDYTPVSQDVIELSRIHQLTVYDSLYLELAIRTQSVLGSLDNRLITAAKSEGLSIAA